MCGDPKWCMRWCLWLRSSSDGWEELPPTVCVEFWEQCRWLLSASDPDNLCLEGDGWDRSAWICDPSGNVTPMDSACPYSWLLSCVPSACLWLVSLSLRHISWCTRRTRADRQHSIYSFPPSFHLKFAPSHTILHSVRSHFTLTPQRKKPKGW